ncbi:hypothetical protein D3C84_955320 [compost metagenome]
MAQVAGSQGQQAQFLHAVGTQADLLHEFASGGLHRAFVAFDAALGQTQDPLLDPYRVFAHQQDMVGIGLCHHDHRLVVGATQALIDPLLAVAEFKVQSFDLEPVALGQEFGLQDGGQAAHGGLPCRVQAERRAH